MEQLKNEHVVLVVDDDDDLGAILVQVLNVAGYHAVHASSAQAALARLAIAPKPCVVLTDVDLVGDSGIELRKRMREDVSLRRVPVLFMTGGMPPAILGELDVSAAVLQKPFSLRSLHTAFAGVRCSRHPCGSQRVLERRNLV
jgi:CheY-like chemotaxis protein